MINQPETQDLLTEARQVLLDSVAPELRGELKYQALMVANAIGMAIREIEQRELGQPGQTDRTVQAFLLERSLEATTDGIEEGLAGAIRERHLDGADLALRSVLRTLTKTRLQINNPGYLKRES